MDVEQGTFPPRLTLETSTEQVAFPPRQTLETDAAPHELPRGFEICLYVIFGSIVLLMGSSHNLLAAYIAHAT
jgi:hypothetical protein